MTNASEIVFFISSKNSFVRCTSSLNLARVCAEPPLITVRTIARHNTVANLRISQPPTCSVLAATTSTSCASISTAGDPAPKPRKKGFARAGFLPTFHFHWRQPSHRRAPVFTPLSGLPSKRPRASAGGHVEGGRHVPQQLNAAQRLPTAPLLVALVGGVEDV
jgi:hypothetical protein